MLAERAPCTTQHTVCFKTVTGSRADWKTNGSCGSFSTRTRPTAGSAMSAVAPKATELPCRPKCAAGSIKPYNSPLPDHADIAAVPIGRVAPAVLVVIGHAL